MDSRSDHYGFIFKKIAQAFILIFLLLSFNHAQAIEQNNGLAIQQFMINGSIYQIEIAQTPQQLQKGLMGRTELGKDKGMLLVFPQFRRQGIWMQGMLVPLTVAWLDRQFNVLTVHQLFPCKVLNCPITKPKLPAAYVLELALDNAIRVGDQLFVIE